MMRLLTYLLLGAPIIATAAPEVQVCYGYHCNHRETVTLKESQWRSITDLFTHRASTAAEERGRIARAIALFEQFVGAVTGTSADLQGNVKGSTMPGQQDCIDESTNTTTYLSVLKQAGLLYWHHPEDRMRRAPRMFDVHWTAVIRDRTDNHLYAVDSWFLDNGLQPYIQPFQAWRRKSPLPFNPDAIE